MCDDIVKSRVGKDDRPVNGFDKTVCVLLLFYSRPANIPPVAHELIKVDFL